MSHLFKRFRRDIIGLVWLSIGIFIALSLFSYNPIDPSFNSVGKEVSVQNYCGYFGSFLSDILYQLLGLSAWIIVISSLRLSVRGFQGKDLHISKLRIFWAFLLMVTCASLGALYWPEVKYFSNHIYFGGIVGLAITKALVKVFNFYGVAVILWTMAAVLFVFYTEKPLSYFFHLPMLVISKVFNRENWGFLVEKFMMIGSMIKDSLRFERKRLAYAGGVRAEDSKAERKFLPLRKSDEEIYEEEYEEEVEEEFEENFEELENPTKQQRSLFTIGKKKQKKRKVELKKKVQRRIENWELPKLSILEDPPYNRNRVDEKEIEYKGNLLVNKLEQFSVRGEVMDAKPGPAVTMFEFKPNVDVKISKITELADDLSLALSSESVRIIAPIPGRDVVGIETSNTSRETVYLKDILALDKFWDDEIKLPLALGCEADGSQKVVDLRKMPHLLVAGSTGSGKSVFVVSMLTGLLFRHSPKTLKLVLIDPKQVDLAAFNDVPHLLMPPIRDAKKALSALKWAIREMDKRYRSMAKFGARGLEAFNEKVSKLTPEQVEDHERHNDELEGAAKLDSYYYTELPYIAIVVEEFGDLMAVDKANVEQAVVRLAQMARACGIHLILAMQSPRKDVVTGLIKTNIPGRVSFKVASKMDSRIILDESGAERLLTRGDMLFLAPGMPKPSRHHGPWVTDDEINDVIKFWKDQAEPEYDTLAMRAIEGKGGGFDLSGFDDASGGEEENEYDERYDEIIAFVSTQKTVSASLLQRRFRLGYPRAARLIEVFESEGVVGPANGSKPRQVLVSELK